MWEISEFGSVMCFVSLNSYLPPNISELCSLTSNIFPVMHNRQVPKLTSMLCHWLYGTNWIKVFQKFQAAASGSNIKARLVEYTFLWQ